jgi:hypothetical protein
MTPGLIYIVIEDIGHDCSLKQRKERGQINQRFTETLLQMHG